MLQELCNIHARPAEQKISVQAQLDVARSQHPEQNLAQIQIEAAADRSTVFMFDADKASADHTHAIDIMAVILPLLGMPIVLLLLCDRLFRKLLSPAPG